MWPAEPVPTRVLIVDDEPDVHQLTELSLRSMRHHDLPLTFLRAFSGAEAVELMRANPDVAVVLLDVVMESDDAGLQACRTIREELGNRSVRILLRTGQPGAAPERETIEGYDIDDYLAKAELTSSRLFVSVRTAIRAHDQLVELEHHRRALAAVHRGALAMRSTESLESILGTVLDTVVEVCPAPLAVLRLDTFSGAGDPQTFRMYVSADGPSELGAARADAIQRQVAQRRREPQHDSEDGDGYLVPINLDADLGSGWIHLSEANPDAVARDVLPLLADHAAGALYTAVARSVLVSNDVATDRLFV